MLWTEALTLVHEGHVPDHVYNAVREHFSDAELMDLSLAVRHQRVEPCLDRVQGGGGQLPGAR